MGRFRLFWGTLIGLSLLFVAFLIWYKATYSMKISPTYSVNTPEEAGELIIITQGSDYKDAIVTGVIDHFKDKNVFIRVADVTQLPDINITEWNTIFILHTWEIGKPPKEIRQLLKDRIDLSHVIFFTTSGSGEEYNRGVDGMTGASRMTDVSIKVQEAIRRIAEVMDMQHIAY